MRGPTRKVDDLDLIERAIQSNREMSEMVNPPSEGMKAHYYRWGQNTVKKKELKKKLGCIKKTQSSRHRTCQCMGWTGGGG